MRRRLVIAFLVVTVPGTLLLGVVTLRSFASLATVTDQLTEITLSLEATRALHLAIADTSRPVAEYLTTGDPALREEFEKLMSRAEEQVASCASSQCHAPSRTPPEMTRVLTPPLAALRREASAVLSAPPGRDATAIAGLARVNATIADIRAQLQPMSTNLLDRVHTLSAQARDVSERASVLGALLTFGIVVTAAAAGLVVAHRLSRPLRDLLHGIRRVMAGDWSTHVIVAGPPEFREVGAAFNGMIDEIVSIRQRIEDDNRTLEDRVRQRTEEIARKDEELAQSARLASLGLLAAGVAHELNNPLTSVMMTTNLLLEEVGPDAPAADELRRIDADVARCKRIIEDLRAFARRTELQKVPSAVEEVIDQALWAARADLAVRAITVERDIAADLPKVVWDPARIVQVLVNLVVNAAQAMDGGGGLVVRARGADGWLRLEVEDSGPGIPVADRARIFDPFFTTKPHGNGLGLSITHGIVTEHGGRLELESRTLDESPASPTGTTIRVLLPL